MYARYTNLQLCTSTRVPTPVYVGLVSRLFEAPNFIVVYRYYHANRYSYNRGGFQAYPVPWYHLVMLRDFPSRISPDGEYM